jgi:hypothetical protein
MNMAGATIVIIGKITHKKREARRLPKYSLIKWGG